MACMITGGHKEKKATPATAQNDIKNDSNSAAKKHNTNLLHLVQRGTRRSKRNEQTAPENGQANGARNTTAKKQDQTTIQL